LSRNERGETQRGQDENGARQRLHVYPPEGNHVSCSQPRDRLSLAAIVRQGQPKLNHAHGRVQA